MPAVPSAAAAGASCSFCEHDNPAGSKFCNECGSPLELRPCIRCNAINHVAALHCHACGMAFPLELVHTDAAAGGDEARFQRLHAIARDRRLPATASALVAALLAGVGFPLLQPGSPADRLVVESASAAPDAALRAADVDPQPSAAPSPEITLAEPPTPPPSELPQRDMTAETTLPAAAAPPVDAKSAPAQTATAAKRAASKNKSTNRSAAARKASRPKDSAVSAR